MTNNTKLGKQRASIYILLIWLACSTVAGIGIWLVSMAITAYSKDSTTLFSGVFELVIFDFIIILAAVIIAYRKTKAVELSVSDDKIFTERLLRLIFFSLGGIVLGLRTWLSVALASRPSIAIPIGLCVLVIIFLYTCVSSFVFTSDDIIRKRIWTPIAYLLALVIPSVILTLYANYLNL